MKIITNNHPRPLACLAELPAKVQTDFDYVVKDGDYTARFVQYKGCWYDVYDTQAIRTVPGVPMGWAMVVAEDSPLADWDSIVSETFFSGVLFRLVGDDQVVVGQYFA
jgi:hypothetical protein